MPQDTHTITLAEAIDELDEQLDEIAAEAAEAEDGSTKEQRLDEQGLRLDQQLHALEYAIEEYGEDTNLVIAELTPGERAEFGDLLEAARAQQRDRQGVEAGGSNLRDLFWVAAGVTEAPWLSGDESLDERVAIVQSEGQPTWHVVQYLRRKVTEQNTVTEGNSNSYAERRAGKTSATMPTSNSPE